MWQTACGYGDSRITFGLPASTGSLSRLQHVWSRGARPWYSIRKRHLPAQLRYGSGLTHGPRLQLLFSSRITFVILICSCVATVPAHWVQDSSFATTFLRPSWSRLSLVGSQLPGGLSPWRAVA